LLLLLVLVLLLVRLLKTSEFESWDYSNGILLSRQDVPFSFPPQPMDWPAVSDPLPSVNDQGPPLNIQNTDDYVTQQSYAQPTTSLVASENCSFSDPAYWCHSVTHFTDSVHP
jgi:hypothetical protein